MDLSAAFHAHLDECRRCERDIFDLCPVGLVLLRQAHNRLLCAWREAATAQPKMLCSKRRRACGLRPRLFRSPMGRQRGDAKGQR